MKSKRIKVLRTVTVADAVSFHLRNTLKYTALQFETIVIGSDVEKLKDEFPEVRFINASISRKISFSQDLIGLYQLIKIIYREKPEITHSIMPKSGLLTAIAARICNVPVRIHTFTGQTWMNFSGLKRKSFIFLDQIVTLLNSVCLTDSFSQSQFLFNNGIHFENNTLPVVGQGSLGGVDLEVFDRSKLMLKADALRQKLNISCDHFIFIFLGRKCVDKGIFELVEAFSRLNDPNTILLLVGPDESNGSLEKRISTNQNILNLPQTDQPQLFLSLAHVFCLPSHREGFGSTVIEAAALGIPTIGTQIPGLRDSVIDGLTGILVKPKDPEELYLAMKKIKGNKRLKEEMSKAAYENTVKNYSARILAEQLIALYEYQLEKNYFKTQPSQTNS